MHDHSHEHDHHHGHHGLAADGERAVRTTLLLTGSFMVVEVVGALVSGSLALLADAGHMLTDTAALGLAWLGFRVGRRQADPERSFGYARFEVLAGLVNAIVLIGLVALIAVEALERLREPAPVLGVPMLVVATIGLVVNVLAFRLLHVGRDHVNVQGALAHVLGDLLGSVAAVIAAVVILTTGWTPIDPLLSLLVAGLVLRSAVGLLRRTSHILLEGTPLEVDAAELEAALARRIDGVRDVHHVHVWSLTSGRNLATLHARVEDDVDVDAVVAELKAVLRDEWGLTHTTVQICPERCLDEAGACGPSTADAQPLSGARQSAR
jgi:cobalt-zinc-cadmium efflux system protein